MIDFLNICKGYGGDPIFDNASFRINAGDRVGIVGPNGAGKSTLFGILTGEIMPDRGEVNMPRNMRIACLKQQLPASDEAARSLIDFTADAIPELRTYNDRLTEIENLLADGNYQAEGVGAVAKADLIGHATVADNLLQLVKFTRDGGKDVVMINWQGHPRGTEPRTIATSNYPGVMRAYVEKNLDCYSIFVLSGSGNLNNNSQIPGEVRFEDYIELGNGLGEEAVAAAANFTPATLDNILFKENLAQIPNGSGTKTVPLYAFSMGDFAMVCAPFEIFDTNARGVREDSDFKMTFYSSCTNKSMGYLPTPMSFDWEIAYEVRITNFPKGTAEIIQAELTAMLDGLFTEGGYTAQEKPEGYLQPDFVPSTDGKTYRNPDPGNTSAYTAVNNSFFAFTLLSDSSFKKMLALDEDLVKQILAKDTVQLIFNEQGVVVGIVE